MIIIHVVKTEASEEKTDAVNSTTVKPPKADTPRSGHTP